MLDHIVTGEMMEKGPPEGSYCVACFAVGPQLCKPWCPRDKHEAKDLPPISNASGEAEFYGMLPLRVRINE